MLAYHGNICISGLTASGKTTHSHLLSGELGLTYVSGSQIQLNLRGVSPIQTRDFWIQDEARALWNLDDFRAIDAELQAIEARADGCVFDTSTMPWRHQRPALNIWLESSFESRVRKAIVSHRGRGTMPVADYPDLIANKDAATQRLYKTLYDIDIGTTFAPFHLVLDISDLIADVTLDASLDSIRRVQSVIFPAAAYFLTGRAKFRVEYEAAKTAGLCPILKDTLIAAAEPAL